MFSKRNFRAVHSLCCLPVFLPGLPASAEEARPSSQLDKDSLIARVVEAHGGERLLDLNTLEKLESRINHNVGQSRRPGGNDRSKVNFHVLFDPVNDRAVMESWYSHYAGDYHISEIFDGKAGHTVDFGIHGYTNNPDSGASGVISTVVRSSSPLLVRDIVEHKEGAKYIGTGDLDGRTHEVLQYDFQGGIPFSVFIDPETFLIANLRRTAGSGTIFDFSFSGYVEQDGIMHETVHTTARDGQLDHESLFVSYRFNQPLEEKYFEVPEGFFGPIESDDVSSMQVNRISDRACHVGIGYGYTLFVDVGDFLVASGGYRGLTQRLEKYREASGNTKPLKYQVVTHHHVDHLGGMAEANELGAIFVTVAENVDSIRAAANAEIPDDRFLLVDERQAFGPEAGERVVVHEMDSPHADGFLVSYLPEEKVLFTVDHFGTLYTNALPAANVDSIYLETEIDNLGLEVERILSAHMPRAFLIEDLRTSNRMELDPCFDNRPVCSE